MKPPVSTRQETIQAILKRSNRQAVPIRRSFVSPENPALHPPLAELVRRHDDRALDLYLLILAQASAGAFDVAHPAAVWARALGLDGVHGAASVSKVLTRLVHYKLVKRDRVGRKAHITLLREDGSGADYTHPATAGDKYLQLSHAYWTDEWDTRLSLPAKAALLIARSFSFARDFFLPIESAPKQFGMSADTVGDGLRELRKLGLLDQRSTYKKAPLVAAGFTTEYRYKLLPPFDKRSSPHSPLATATAPGVP